MLTKRLFQISLLFFFVLPPVHVAQTQELPSEQCNQFLKNENIKNLDEIEWYFKKLTYFASGGDEVGAGNDADRLLKINSNSKLLKYYLCKKNINYEDFFQFSKMQIAKRDKFNKSLNEFVKKFPPKKEAETNLDSRNNDGPLICHEMKISDEISHLICD